MHLKINRHRLSIKTNTEVDQGSLNIDDKNQEGTKKNNKYVHFREKKVSMMVICLLLNHPVA